MKKLKTLAVVALVSLMSLAVVTEDAFARGGRSGGSRSYSRPAPRPAPRPTVRKVTPVKATPAKSWGSKKAIAPKTGRATAKPKMSAAQTKSLETAKKNGTTFKSKDAATAAFKAKEAGKYPSKYPTQPAKRPEHIPSTTMVNGKSVNVTYNVERGCYGYGSGPGLGTFIAYNMMSDAIMRDRYMARSHYMVQPVMVQQPVVVRTGPSIGTIIIITLGIVIVLAVIVVKSKGADINDMLDD